MSSERELVDILIRKQRQLQLSDADMATRLNISRELWNKTRLGHKRVRAKLLHGIIRGFPELTADALNFLRGNGTIVSPPMPSVPRKSSRTRQETEGVPSAIATE